MMHSFAGRRGHPHGGGGAFYDAGNNKLLASDLTLAHSGLRGLNSGHNDGVAGYVCRALRPIKLAMAMAGDAPRQGARGSQWLHPVGWCLRSRRRCLFFAPRSPVGGCDYPFTQCFVPRLFPARLVTWALWRRKALLVVPPKRGARSLRRHPKEPLVVNR